MMSLSVPSISAQEVAPSNNNPQSLLQQGIQAYQNQQFSVAISLWQQAVRGFELVGDSLSRGLVLSNLSLAYQHLGQWQMAQEAINESLQLLPSIETNSVSGVTEIRAKIWNTQGRLFWEEGKLQEALNAWEKATDYYGKADNWPGIIGTKLNQVRVLQALGLTLQAQDILTSIEQNLDSIQDDHLKASGLLQLGLNLRQMGDFIKSREILQQGLSLVKDSETQQNFWLELGNTEQALEQKALVIGRFQEAKKHIKAALDYYEKAANISQNDQQILSLLNQFSLLIDHGNWEKSLKLIPVIEEKLNQLSPSRDSIYAHLNFAHNLACLKQSIDRQDYSCIDFAHREQLLQEKPRENINLNTPSWETIAKIIVTAIEQSQILKDSVVQSLALGQMGELYETTQQWGEAQKLTEQALFILDNIQVPELSYRWEWQLGRLLKKQEKITDAIASYKAAVNSLNAVRGDLITVTSDIQFSFRDRVEPVYRELVDLLLTSKNNQDLSGEDLQEAIEQIDALQIAELENFLRCQLKIESSIEQTLNQVDSKAAFIYPIILQDRLQVIIKLPGKPLISHKVTISEDIVKKTIKDLRIAILRRNAGQVTANGSTLYNWLIEPIKNRIQPDSEVETLVFVLDGELRNIPLGVLYDAKTQQYLIEKNYNLAILPSSQLFKSPERKPQSKTVLSAGISEELEVENRYFSPLNVTEELEQINQVLPSEILLNNQFNSHNVQDNLEQKNYSIVHLATHGNFSSDPQETFILAYNNAGTQGKLLRPHDINNLLYIPNSNSSKQLNLLVLSACQTALGDNRATLGLAGLAVRSGANSTIATLWQVSDESTIKLMKEFYTYLNQPGISKAQALRLARLALLKDKKYQNPYYWSAYILVGDWH
ncbi:CHAT domain-containing protein [Gloeothece citriformis]|nr:CHAT domain-containing protein [Gloeothece citriformis]